jgi:NAD+ diphosphatase
MIQDIAPKKLDNTFRDLAPCENDVVLSIQEEKIFCRGRDETLEFPRLGQIETAGVAYIYLFSIDETRYFLAEPHAVLKANGFDYHGLGILRKLGPKDVAYAGVTGYHLHHWYRDNCYCGRCGGRTVLSHAERRIDCPACGHQVYPQIAPCIIVAVTDGDRLLLTRYAGRAYKRYALVAGFSEIGESSEDTVRREVWEETGVRVKNIRFYKSQPWGFSGSLLMGYFAELDGDPTITLEEDELSEAVWKRRDEIDYVDEGISLTGEMIQAFVQEGTA